MLDIHDNFLRGGDVPLLETCALFDEDSSSESLSLVVVIDVIDDRVSLESFFLTFSRRSNDVNSLVPSV